MKKKKIVIALGHEALGTTLPEQKEATKRTAKAVADFIREDYQVVITHSNGPQIGMIHTAMNEFVIISGIYCNTNVCMFCDEPGIYRLRFTECDPCGIIEQGNL